MDCVYRERITMQGAGAIVAARLPCVRMSTWVNCPIALENVLADKGVHVYHTTGLSVSVVASRWGCLLTLGPALAGWSPVYIRPLKTYWRIGAIWP